MNHTQYLEEVNYARDPRVTCGRADLPELNGEPLPHRWVVCPICRGEGKHVNPSIDASGISAEQFHDDPDFAEEYMSGAYDVTCNHCGGRTTVPEVDVEACTFAQKRVLAERRRQARRDAEYRAEMMAELRMGA